MRRTHSNNWWKISSALLLVSALDFFSRNALAQGGPPLLTDDPFTPGDRNWEINVAAVWEHRGKKWLLETPQLDVNYGWGERTQLKYEIPYLILDQSAAGAKGGVGNSLIGTKWRFLDEDTHGLAMSVYPQFEFNTVEASRRRGLVSGNKELRLPFQMARSFGKFSINPELGHTLVERQDDEWLYGLAFGYRATDQFEVLAEVHGIASWDFGEDELVFQLGARQDITKHFGLLFAAGRGLRSRSGDEIKCIGYFGVQFRF